MKSIRIIPRLDIKGPNLVKGIHLEGLRVLGKPWDFAYKYYQEGADELLYIDAVASLYGRNNLLDIVKKTSESAFIPLTVGGGIRSLDDIKNLLNAGADKVAINTGAIADPELITQAAQVFGSQCIVASIQSKHIAGKQIAFTDNGREITSYEVVAWAKQLVELGAGEILLTSIDCEGTGRGYDLELLEEIADTVPIPVIGCGGCGNQEHFLEAIQKGKVDAVSASSIFHYKYLSEILDFNDYEAEGNLEFKNQNRGSLNFMASRLMPTGIPDVKGYLQNHGIKCRMDGVVG